MKALPLLVRDDKEGHQTPWFYWDWFVKSSRHTDLNPSIFEPPMRISVHEGNGSE